MIEGMATAAAKKAESAPAGPKLAVAFPLARRCTSGGFPIHGARGSQRLGKTGGAADFNRDMVSVAHDLDRGNAVVDGVAAVIADLRTEVAACRLCPAMKPFDQHPPQAFGTTTTGYMLVGDSPRGGERPFCDSKGQVMREALAAVDDGAYRDLEDLFFIADAVRCRPPNRQNAKRTRTPTKGECGNCRPYLMFEMRALHPRLILAVGKHGAEAVLGRPVKIEAEHGCRTRVGDIEVLPLITPSPHNRISLRKLGLTIDDYRRHLTELFAEMIATLR